MADERISNELVYEVLKSIQGRLDRIDDRLGRVEKRLDHMGDLIASLVRSDLSRDAEMAAMDARIARIERRLDLTEGAGG